MDAYSRLLASENKPDDDTLYFISNPSNNDVILYLGSKMIAGTENNGTGANSPSFNIDESLKDKQLLIYDMDQEAWVNGDLSKILTDFIGASSTSDGIAGLVPAPKQGQTDLFLRSDGTWAKVSTGSTVVADNNVVTIESTDKEADHLSLIENAVKDLTLAKGDIAIVRILIIDDKWEYTSYVFDGERWAPMDGNYNADNVYFDDNLVVTTTIGTITELKNGQATLEAKGKNIKQVLSALLAQRKVPTASSPSASISLTNAGSYEAGTKIIPAWKTTFSAGSYTYGPATGVTDAGGSVTSTKDTTGVSVAAGSLNGATGQFAEYQVADGVTYKASLSYGWNAGTSTPVDNFGDDYASVKIEAAENKSASSSNSITSYRAWFKGGLNTGSEVALTSDMIRGLGASSSVASAGDIEIQAVDFEGCKRIVIAIPTSTKAVKKVYLKSASNADITSEFVKQSSTLDIEGAEGFTAKPYDVWVYAPATIDPSEVYTITIG